MIGVKKYFILFAAVFLILSGCASGKNNTNNAENNSSANTENVENNDNDTNEANEAEEIDEDDILTGEGIYKHHDEDTMEIETEDGKETFHLSKEAMEDMEYLDEDEEVKFTHYPKGKNHHKIDFIEKKENFDNPRKHHKHHKHPHHEKHHDQGHHHKNQGHKKHHHSK